jgi:LmbE family N-acetylglucosaminyl deacetylase
MMLWVALFPIPLLIVAGWLYTVGATKGRFPLLKNKRICLLIAHPDDEAMFFAPALLALTNPVSGNHVKILCLSSGEPIRSSNLIALTMLARRCGWFGRDEKEGACQEWNVTWPEKGR